MNSSCSKNKSNSNKDKIKSNKSENYYKKNYNSNGYNSDTSKSKILSSKNNLINNPGLEISRENIKNRNSDYYNNYRPNNMTKFTNISNPHYDKQRIQQAESKIKSKVETDKKIYSLLQKRNTDQVSQVKEYNSDRLYNSKYKNYNYEHPPYQNIENETFIEKDELFNRHADENSVINNLSYLRECEGSFQNDESIKLIDKNNKENKKKQKCNWAIEYDKELKPQILKEKDDNQKIVQVKQYPNKDCNLKNYHTSQNYSYIKNENYEAYQNEEENYQEASSTYQSQSPKTPLATHSNEAISHRKNASSLSTYSRKFPSDSPYAAINTGMTNITNFKNQDETFLREQTINNYINNNYKREAQGSSRVVSPHFGRNQNFFSSNEENEINQRSQMDEPFTIQNENIVSPESNPHKISHNSRNSENSDKLSSYTPSERTKSK
jgi:hypothetical protein